MSQTCGTRHEIAPTDDEKAACEEDHNSVCPTTQPSVPPWTDTDVRRGQLNGLVDCERCDPRTRAGPEVATGGWFMISPYGMEIVESCLACKLREDRSFCDLPPTALQAFENIKYATAYPQKAILFVEGQLPRGIFVLCKGRVKLSINSPSGRTVIVKLVEPGEG